MCAQIHGDTGTSSLEAPHRLSVLSLEPGRLLGRS
jgi:hypothetical protein